jgi:phospholipase C
VRLRRSVLLFATLAASACNSSNGTTPAPGPTARAPTPIQHIVVLVQENRSFNNVFAGFPGATTALEGPCKPAKSAPWCKGSHIVKLHAVKL